MNKEIDSIVIDLQNISKSFYENDKEVNILKDLNLQISKGEKIAIIGPSGSGKSTMLSLLAGLDVPDMGNVLINNKNLKQLTDRQLAEYRNQDIGIIFQSFELILPFTVYENVSAPQDIKKVKDENLIKNLLENVSLTHKIESNVVNLSGGEKQRTAIARALANNPGIILADEPTGSLDRETGKAVLKLLIDLSEIQGKTLIIITHDSEVASKMDKTYLLQDKKLILQ